MNMTTIKLSDILDNTHRIGIMEAKTSLPDNHVDPGLVKRILRKFDKGDTSEVQKAQMAINLVILAELTGDKRYLRWVMPLI